MQVQRFETPAPGAPKYYDRNTNTSWSYIFVGLVSFACFWIFDAEIGKHHLEQHSAYYAFSIVCLNSLAALMRNGNNSYIELTILMDYMQEIAVLPFLITEFLTVYGIVPFGLSLIPIFFAGITMFLFLLLEFKRQDLSDLNTIINLIIYFAGGILYNNYACLSAIIMGIAYFMHKRNEIFCLTNSNLYNILLSLFLGCSVLSLNVNWSQKNQKINFNNFGGWW